MTIKVCRLRREGFSLVEVMIAVLVLGVGITAIASMQAANFKSADSARWTLVNSLAVAKQLEAILALPYDDDRLSDPDDGYALDHPDHGPFAIEGTASLIEWEVDDNFPVPHAKRVTVTVGHPLKGGHVRRIRYNYLKVSGCVP